MIYLDFQRLPRRSGRVTDTWDIVSKVDGARLGRISWRAGWRRYVWRPASDVIFDAQCLRQLADFLSARTQEHRETL